MVSILFPREQETHHDKPKTPLIAGIVCGVCIGIAWAISFCNWLLKRYRRHNLKKKRRLREASGTSTYYQHSQRRRDRRRTAATATAYNNPSTSEVNVASNRATGTAARSETTETDDDARSNISQRIDRLVREVSRDSENPRVNHENLTGAYQGDNTGNVITLKPPSGPAGRYAPSWVPEPFWNKRRQSPPASPRDRDHHNNADLVQSPTTLHKGDSDDEDGDGKVGDGSYPMAPVSPITDPRTQRVASELEDIDVQETVQTGRHVARTLFGT